MQFRGVDVGLVAGLQGVLVGGQPDSTIDLRMGLGAGEVDKVEVWLVSIAYLT